MAVISKDLGAVTAYASAVEGGYTGTKEEFGTLMASYATVAEEAAESAESASTSATNASASAQTATTKASEASQSATQASASATSASQSASTATAKASEASASASTASTKAGEASTSATTASSKASEASASATSAQTAQGLAESARNDAIDAKTDAENARDLAQQYADSIDPDNIFSAYATDTASGSVATFEDGADDIPMKSVKVAIDPVQSGSGDPSPDNVRPISGWTGAHVWRAGKNLVGQSAFTHSGPLTDEGNIGTASNRLFSDYIKVNPGSDYYIAIVGKSSANEDLLFNKVIFYDENKTFISRLNTGINRKTSATFTIPIGVAYIALDIRTEQLTTPLDTSNVIELTCAFGSTATDYEPYVSNTYSFTFPSEAGMVYGGTLDVTSGTLTVDRAFIASYNGETLPSEWISDRDKYVAGTTPTTGAQVVYKLATPITYTLTPTEIKSLLGDNNIWADAGSTEVTYRADTKLYIDKKIAEAVSALA